MKWLCFLAFVTFCYGARGSILRFEGSPTDIKDGLTDRLQLHCALVDTAASSGVIGRRDVTQTADNVALVTSLVVRKDGRLVAAMNRSTTTPVTGDPENTAATGGLAGASGQRAYLNITIASPSTQHSGDYVCQATATTSIGGNVVFSRTIKISVSTPTKADLLKAGVISPADIVSPYNGVNPGQAKVFSAVLSNATEGDYDSRTGTYVAPRDGMYKFVVNALGGIRGNGTYWFSLSHNGQDVSLEASSAHVEVQGNSKVVTLRLSKGDVIKIVAWQQAAGVLARHHHVYLSYNGQVYIPHKRRSSRQQ